MCGILGTANVLQSDSGEVIPRCRDTMHHRGPDDAGMWLSPDRRVALAQRRLAIIDLSPGGHQPLSNTQQKCWVTFNGEIYNHIELRNELEARGYRFRSSSDTEVLLAAYCTWGTQCLERLQGMFAFAIYDMDKQHLFLARDRAGEKPLFYSHCHGSFGFRFASELKALLADRDLPKRINVHALELYFTFGYVPGDECMIDGVKKLRQGHAMIYDVAKDRLHTWCYWQLPQPTAEYLSEQQLLEQLNALLFASVRRQLVADVPVGILLSGGIDSSLVTAMAARASGEPVRTFTVSFPGHQTHDEAKYARMVASHFGTRHTELTVEASSVDLLPQLAVQFDEPMADSSMVPTYLVSRLIRQHATVALGGDGGDELFGGYFHHSWIQQLAARRRLLPRLVRQFGRHVAARCLPVGLRGRNYALSLLSDDEQGLAQFNIYFDSVARRSLLRPVHDRLSGTSCENYKTTLAQRHGSPLQKATAVDFMSYLVDDILVKVDRASMLASLEVRAPLLDAAIIEFAFRDVPDHLKATTNERKILPRMLAERLLPKGMDLTRKQGFSLPLHSWFRGQWGEFVSDVLSSADPQLFDRRAIQRLIRGQRYGFSNTQRLFAVTMFELWRRHYGVTL